MKHLILSSLLVVAFGLPAASAEEKKKSSRNAAFTPALPKAKGPRPTSRSESTATSTQFITKDGKSDGTVTVTINKDGKTEVKTWKIGGGGGVTSFQPAQYRTRSTSSASRMEKVTWLGVAVTDVSEDLASQLPLPTGVGLRVRQVIEDSPASRAGIRANDLISQLDEQMIFNVQQFQALTRTYEAGEEVEITYYRKGRKGTATAKLAKKEMLVNSAISFPAVDWKKYPDPNTAWKNIFENRAKAEARHQQALEATKRAEENAKRAHEAAKFQNWIRNSPASKRAVIVRPDGKTTVVRSMEQIRKNLEKALKEAGVSEKIMKDTLKAFDKGIEGNSEN